MQAVSASGRSPALLNICIADSVWPACDDDSCMPIANIENNEWPDHNVSLMSVAIWPLQISSKMIAHTGKNTAFSRISAPNDGVWAPTYVQPLIVFCRQVLPKHREPTPVSRCMGHTQFRQERGSCPSKAADQRRQNLLCSASRTCRTCPPHAVGKSCQNLHDIPVKTGGSHPGDRARAAGETMQNTAPGLPCAQVTHHCGRRYNEWDRPRTD